MERVIGAAEARVHFGELMRQVTEKEQTVVVERDGTPQVVVLSVAAYERLRCRRRCRLGECAATGGGGGCPDRGTPGWAAAAAGR
jgi:prevent-host-death family protein